MLKRCECGRIIWPWQKWTWGYEATTLHEKCVERSEPTDPSVPDDASNLIENVRRARAAQPAGEES